MQTRNILLFNPVGKNAKVSVYFQDGTFWLTQKAMAELFGVNVPAVSKRLKNIFETGELEMTSTVSILETVQKEGKREGYIKNETRKLEFLQRQPGIRLCKDNALFNKKQLILKLNEIY